MSFIFCFKKSQLLVTFLSLFWINFFSKYYFWHFRLSFILQNCCSCSCKSDEMAAPWVTQWVAAVDHKLLLGIHFKTLMCFRALMSPNSSKVSVYSGSRKVLVLDISCSNVWKMWGLLIYLFIFTLLPIYVTGHCWLP